MPQSHGNLQREFQGREISPCASGYAVSTARARETPTAWPTWLLSLSVGEPQAGSWSLACSIPPRTVTRPGQNRGRGWQRQGLRSVLIPWAKPWAPLVCCLYQAGQLFHIDAHLTVLHSRAGSLHVNLIIRRSNCSVNIAHFPIMFLSSCWAKLPSEKKHRVAFVCSTTSGRVTGFGWWILQTRQHPLHPRPYLGN